MKAVIAGLKYARDLAKKADEAFHSAYGKFDEILHANLAKLDALIEKLEAAFASESDPNAPVAAAGPYYGALDAAAQAEVDAQFDEVCAAAA